MIEVIGLTKTYGLYNAVDQVSFKLEKGETLALVGTSGSGKTTTLKLINRLIEPTQGRILLNGEDVFALPPEQMRRKMGYVIQNIGLFPHYTIAQNIAVVPRLLGWPQKEIDDRSATLMERLKLPWSKFAHKYPHQLSGGQQQRVGIARALAGDPPIILMDEPFGALDPITRKDVRQDFINMEELSSKTTIIVTHDIEEAFELADRICVLDKGKVQQTGTHKELLFHPANDFIRAFVADKKLDLQLQVVTLKDLISFLPEKSDQKAGKMVELKKELSVKKLLNLFYTKDKAPVVGWIQNGGTRKKVDAASLMLAFQEFISN